MKVITSVSTILITIGIVASAHSGHAAQGACGRTASNTQYDSFYSSLWGCMQSRIDDMWSRFDFDKSDWDNGMGYEEPCNNDLPLKRTFNALQVLAYSVTPAPTCDTSNANVGLWAYCWAGNSIDELDSDCGTQARATTRFGFLIDNYTKLYQPFFYDENVIQRAATLFHEARHASGWCRHQGTCAWGNCDPEWTNGCVGTLSGSGRGANGYTVIYLNWFATSARSSWINTSIKASAITEANGYLANRFEVDPCIRLSPGGYLYEVC